MSDNKPSANPALAESSWESLLQDLAILYDNPEVFSDSSLPFLPRFRIVSTHLPNRPAILSIEIGDDLLPAIRETFFAMIRDVRGAEEKLLNEHGDSDWESFRAQTIGDDEYLGLEREMCWFFFRHFPKLLLRLYDIAMRVSVIHMARMLEDNAARQEREKDLKRSLARMVRDLQKDIHQMLGTRKRGGSTGKLRPDLRKSLHLEYENIYPIAKTIKKQYENLRKTFNASRHRAGLDEWQEFWNESAGKLFPDIAPDFLTLFASADNPSASDVAYVWISQSTTLSQSYVRKKIKELRKAAKGTVETPE